MANREHKAYPNIRETPFYSPQAGLACFHEWTLNTHGPLIAGRPPIELSVVTLAIE
ncbi:hypothetical protein [Novipirellula sp.]|uniref:hypothetical protein n=1 Tax=Novipirellula sp. TaxID=2795430 RepID=UPI003561AAC2